MNAPALSRVDELHLRYDGPIPAHELAWAAEQDRLHPIRVVPPAPAPRPPRFRASHELIAAMARVIVARVTARGDCAERDLAAAGFTAAELARFGEQARVQAAAELAGRDLDAERAPAPRRIRRAGRARR